MTFNRQSVFGKTTGVSRPGFFSVLRDKMIGLGRDEDGAALVITLAIFFLMYLGCMGVYAVSMAVKERIHLQNAADAAAYSAAVVQADTLSRIATINRAMSWTYVDMTRRQMDSIVYKWLKHTCEHFDDDRRAAQDHVNAGFPCGRHRNDMHCGWMGINGLIRINDSQIAERTVIGAAVTFFAAKHIMNLVQIPLDKAAIILMNEREKTLAKGLPGRVNDAVRDVLAANLGDVANCFYAAFHSDDPLNEYMRVMRNNAGDESQFLSFADFPAPSDTFENGIDDWFVRGRGELDEGGDGILRSYYHSRRDKLFSRWDWHATRWYCFWVPWHMVHLPWPKFGCDHSHEKDECRYSVSGVEKNEAVEEYSWSEVDGKPEGLTEWPYKSADLDAMNGSTVAGSDYSRYYRVERGIDKNGRETVRYYVIKKTVTNHTYYAPDLKAGIDLAIARVDHTATCYADNDQIYDENLYVGQEARPLVLTDRYFCKAGTISVGVRRKNENVFLRILRKIEGIFTAFDPDWNGAGEPTHTYVFASAKAGYKDKGDDADSREYKIDWQPDNQAWNLCQSDWDAVFVPVRRAHSCAKSGLWFDGGDGMLEEWVVTRADEWKPVDGGGGEDFMCRSIYAPPGVLRGKDTKGRDHNGILDWEELSHVMYH